MTHNEKIVEAVARAIQGAIKVDASGLAPAVIGHYVTGFEEAARAAITAFQACNDKNPTAEAMGSSEITVQAQPASP